MINATLNLFVSQSLRPDSERFRSNYFKGIDLSSTVVAEIAPVMVSLGLATFDASTGLTPVAGQEDEPIDDGRTAQGNHAAQELGVLQVGELVHVDHLDNCSRSGSRRCDVERLRPAY
jgi:hypothetical protein